MGHTQKLYSGNHPRFSMASPLKDSRAKQIKNDTSLDVVIEKYVWIVCNVTLLSGTNIGRGSILAAGAIVSKDVTSYSFVGGIRAKFIKFK